MRHLDLFSGIGGFALAAEAVWPDVEHVFCDNDPFSQAVLRKHWPNAPIYGDIKELTKDRIVADTYLHNARGERPESEWGKLGTPAPNKSSWEGVDLLTGGFPCQPFSAAGRRRGTEDDRHLWPEMLRVIREVRPRWVLGENVGGFLTWDGGMVFEQVCTDLEAEGYEVCPLVIPACAVNAPHRRDRVWIAAHAVGSDAVGTSRQFRGEKAEERLQERDEVGEPRKPGRARVPSDPEHARQHGSKDGEGGTTGSNGNKTREDEDEQLTRPVVSRNDAADGTGERGEHGGLGEQGNGTQRKERLPGRDAWDEDWPTVAARLCTLDDGLPDGLVRPRGWRNAALKGAGNAIVPQVAAEILKAMKLCSEQQ